MPKYFDFEKPGKAAILPAPEEPVKNVLLFGGDVMLSRTVGQQLEKYKDFAWPFRQVADVFWVADIAVINLESPFLQTKNYFVPTGSFYFKADPRSIEGLNLAGIDLVALANNHFGNQGQKGMADTFSWLEENKINYVGAGRNETEAHEGKIIESRGVKFGFLAYAYPETADVATGKLAGFANMDLEKMKLDVATLRPQADVLIILMHAGIEYTTEPNWQQKDFAHEAISAGVDLIVGHHPHWPQKFELYQGKPIFYSLGNLVFDQMWSMETRQGAVLRLDFEDKKIIQAEIMPVQIEDYGQPAFMTEASRINKVLRQMGLNQTKIDFLPR